MSWNDLRKGRFSEPQREYFITFNCDNRCPLFLQSELANIFCQTIIDNEAKCDCKLLTWVLMPDHFHGLLQLGDKADLSKVIRHLKGVSAFQINKIKRILPAVWQKGYFDRALRLKEDRKKVARYIAANPLRKNIVSNLGVYPYWNSIYL